jgi:hypothetical protein
VLDRAGFRAQHATLVDGGREVLGVGRAVVERIVAGSVALLNVNGYLDDETILGLSRRRVFVDIDPGFSQLWRIKGWHDAFAGHDAVVTVGLEALHPSNLAGATGLPTVTTLPPVAIDQWPLIEQPPHRRLRFTTVVTWRGPFAPIEHDGVRYGLRVHEFRRFADVPGAAVGADLELALDFDAADGDEVGRLSCHGWGIVDPARVVATMPSYRDYIAASSGEFQIAKGLYVQARTGWFSDRSACYLASGRPVIAQDTGFSEHVPTGKGLLAFADPAEAADAIAEVTGNLALHGAAARDLAVEHFDAARVLARVLYRLDLI